MRLLELSNFECLPGKAGGSPFCISCYYLVICSDIIENSLFNTNA